MLALFFSTSVQCLCLLYKHEPSLRCSPPTLLRPSYPHPINRSHSTLLPEASSNHASGSNCFDGAEGCIKHRSRVPLQRPRPCLRF